MIVGTSQGANDDACDGSAQVGVELTDSFLMKPNETLSGIHLLTGIDFRSRQGWRRAAERSGAFNAHLWELHQHS